MARRYCGECCQSYATLCRAFTYIFVGAGRYWLYCTLCCSCVNIAEFIKYMCTTWTDIILFFIHHKIITGFACSIITLTDCEFIQVRILASSSLLRCRCCWRPWFCFCYGCGIAVAVSSLLLLLFIDAIAFSQCRVRLLCIRSTKQKWCKTNNATIITIDQRGETKIGIYRFQNEISNGCVPYADDRNFGPFQIAARACGVCAACFGGGLIVFMLMECCWKIRCAKIFQLWMIGMAQVRCIVFVLRIVWML